MTLFYKIDNRPKKYFRVFFQAMGVPDLFTWLRWNYPDSVIGAIEMRKPVSATRQNPNCVFFSGPKVGPILFNFDTFFQMFHNLYLDFNSILHLAAEQYDALPTGKQKEENFWVN
jgi:5'-3' exonuclease